MWNEYGYKESDMQAEHVFDDSIDRQTKRYRLDFAWPSCKVGVEIHGFGFGHQSIKGLQQDCEKIRHAMMLGWIVLPFSQACISSKENCEGAVALVCEMLSRRHGKIEWN
jgi:very-short-patch-repair endonuclease